MRNTSMIASMAAAVVAGSAVAATVNVNALGASSGWYSDDTRNTSGTVLNGTVMQEGTTADMIFDVPAIVEFFSASMVLRPGTVILTGTPAGVGMARTPPVFLQPGDVVTVEIDRVGRLTNPVAEEPV
jgi:2-keto-4-pentenoate hydratase/2-oxohepta-3-ene-1,7-dioic acid hydratase in catechol pathway